MTTDIIIGVAGIVLGFITSYIFYRIQKDEESYAGQSIVPV